jgi:predicted DNA-binding transcriptional regulator AlpA
MREPERIIRLKTVLSRTGLSRSTIYRKIVEGTFPAQLKISTNGSGRLIRNSEIAVELHELTAQSCEVARHCRGIADVVVRAKETVEGCFH